MEEEEEYYSEEGAEEEMAEMNSKDQKLVQQKKPDLNFCEEFNDYEYGSLGDFKPPTTQRTEQSIAVDKSSAKPVSGGHRDSGIAENEPSIYEHMDMLAELKSDK